MIPKGCILVGCEKGVYVIILSMDGFCHITKCSKVNKMCYFKEDNIAIATVGGLII